MACDANTPAATAAGVNSKPSTISGFGGAGELIMPRVDHFTVQLGVRNTTGNMAYYTINQYRLLAKNAQAAAPPTEPPRIVSVKLAVLVRSMDNTRNESINLTQAFNTLNQSVRLNDQNTKFARRVYSTVVTFRNGLGNNNEKNSTPTPSTWCDLGSGFNDVACDYYSGSASHSYCNDIFEYRHK